VIAPEVGGGFGAKIGAYPEDIILAAIALHTHRPVKWYETRSEHFIATNQGRGQVAYYELAATKEGRVLGLRLKVIQDLGGYPKVMLLAPLTAMMSVGVYDIPQRLDRDLQCLHKQDTDRCLPRRRTSGGRLLHRANDGSSGPPHRQGSG